MKTITAICAVLLCLKVNAATYYFSSSQGNDARTSAEAKNPATPWKSIDKLNTIFSTLSAGDVIAFKKGDTFYGSIIVTRSGSTSSPITFTSYGSTGDKPVITGFFRLTGWKQNSENVYESSVPNGLSSANIVLKDGIVAPLGRYPNADAAEQGYLGFQASVANTSIVDNQLAGKNFTGGDIVIRKNRWVVDRNKIALHAGPSITYLSQSGYFPDKGYGYFIQNHPATLDKAGEWYYNSAEKKLGIYTYNPGKLNVDVSTIDALVQVQNQSNIVFDGLAFTGSNQNTFVLTSTTGVSIINCDLLYNGGNAVSANSAEKLLLENCLIYKSNNNAITYTGNGAIIKNNVIRCTGTVAGLGAGDAGSYEGIMITGNSNTVELNQVDSVGYIPITFSGSNVIIKNNYISNYAFVKDDGGGIYTWNNSSNPPAVTNRVVTGNVVMNAIGASAGTPDKDKNFAHGIYVDDNSANVTIDGNTVANCNGNGLYIHNARSIGITNNTVYNNQVQLTMQHDDIAPNSPVNSNTVKGNIFFSLKSAQPVAEFKTRTEDLGTFGNFDNNYYCRPINENASISTLKKVNGAYTFQQLDLDGWKSLYGKDANSKTTAKEISAFTINKITGANQFSNGAFTSNTGGLYTYASANNLKATWSSNALDGGTLQLAFSSQTSPGNKGTIIIGIGAVQANKSYVLKFSLKGSNNEKNLEVYLRKSLSPYNDITDRKLVKIDQDRSEVLLLFFPTETQSNASIGIDIPEQNKPVYIDNIQLTQATVTATNIEDSVTFIYNPTAAAKNLALSGSYVDVKNTRYAGQASLNAFSSAILLQAGAGNTANAPTAQCSATGYILREQWSNVGGNNLVLNNWNAAPNLSSTITSFEGPVNLADNYASRIRGYICPPTSGNYTFWIAGDDETELYLSTSDNPSDKQKVAYCQQWTDSRQWNKFATQQSGPVKLEAGKRYYIEALHKEGSGGDNVAVAWQLPNGTIEAPIPGSRLSPFTSAGTGTSAAAKSDQVITFAAIADVYEGAAGFKLSAASTSGLPVQFSLVSGPATLTENNVTVTGPGTVVIEALQAGNANFNAAPGVRQSFHVLANASCSATGYILREQWNNIGGNAISSNTWNSNPLSSGQINIFEGPTNVAENYASRIRGYICPPASGNYTFWIAGDDETELYLSTNENPSTKIKIAYSLQWTNAREWNKFATQKSASISLEAGKKYYIEALHKEGGGGDNLAAAWQLPSGMIEAPIPGNRLSPFIAAPVVSKTEQTISFPAIADVYTGAAAFALAATSSSGLPVTFKAVSGPATVIGNMCTPTGVGTVQIEASQPGSTSYNAALPVVKSFNVLANITCSATGSILHEVWSNVSGNNIAGNNWSSNPASSSQLSLFEGPSNAADNYASRIRGYLCPPATGSYIFWIAGDDETELYLSTNDNPTNKVKIAYSLQWTGSREWNKYLSQKSTAIYLEAGKKYYIEALHKEGGGGDNLAVAWQLPSGLMEAPIPGIRLSPAQALPQLSNQTITFPALADVTFGVVPIELKATASSGLPVTYKLVSGQATLSSSTLTVTGAGVVVIEASQNGNPAYNAAPSVQQSFTVLASSTCSAMGTILRQYWSNVNGNAIASQDWGKQPSGADQLKLFEAPENNGDNYATRISGYICPPQTGNYTFWIAGDDATELYLSTDDAPGNKIKIAYSLSWTGSREWYKFPTQQSASVYLKAGNKYYIEALHKEGGGGDNLAVGWQLPDKTLEMPIPGNRLSPYSSAAKRGTVSQNKSSSVSDVVTSQNPSINVYPNPVKSKGTIAFSLPATDYVMVELVDLQGRSLKRLFSGITEAGMKKWIMFDASSIAAGVYIIRLTYGGHVAVQKLSVSR